MKKETWKTILQVLASIITAALTALGTTSCKLTWGQARCELKNRGCNMYNLYL